MVFGELATALMRNSLFEVVSGVPYTVQRNMS